jgi:hypothetical protein
MSMYAAIAKNIEERAGVSVRDVFIFTHENDYSDWSVVFVSALVPLRTAVLTKGMVRHL